MPKVVDHDQRRQEILDGCLSLFAQQGYAKLSMRQLSSSLGVTTGTLYHYFSSKKQIFQALFRRTQRQNIRTVTERFKPNSSVEERLIILRDFICEDQRRLQDILKIAMEYQRIEGQDESSVIRQTVLGYRRAFEEHIQLPPVLAEVILSMVFGILVQGILDPEMDSSAQWEILLALAPTVLS